MKKPTLIYFAARGRAELIRLVLAEAGVDYTEHTVSRGSPPSNGRPTDFGELKTSGLLPYGAVPVWEESDEFILAQSSAIANHLARRHGLRGKSEKEEALCDELLGAFEDVRGELRKLAVATPEHVAAARSELESIILPRWFGHLEKRFGPQIKASGFACGATLTVADLALWYLIELTRDNGLGASLKGCPALLGFSEKIAARPRIAAYLASPGRPAFTPLAR